MPRNNAKLALIQGIMEGAFFTPVHKNDWLAYCFGQPSLTSLEEDEVFDLFVRGAIACQTIYPEEAEGRDPLAWLWSMEDPNPVWAHALASLRSDRPYLFHRSLLAIPAVAQERVDPEDFELMEDFLAQALAMDAGDFRQAAAGELSAVCNRCLAAAGFSPPESAPDCADQAREVLARPQAAELDSDAEIRLWLALGDGLEGVDPESAPAVMVEVWRRWAGAVIGARPDMDLMARLHPNLALSAPELALYAPPAPQSGEVINAVCPYCNAQAVVKLGKQVQKLAGCEHLVYLSPCDEAHLMEVLAHFELGRDFSELMNSYYQSPPDLNLFAVIVNDLYEMFLGQGRLMVTPVSCQSNPRGYYNLRAFFAGPPPEEDPPRH